MQHFLSHFIMVTFIDHIYYNPAKEFWFKKPCRSASIQIIQKYYSLEK